MCFRSSSSLTFFAARASYSLRRAEGSWTDTPPPIVLEMKLSVPWPVNVRCLQNRPERAGVFCYKLEYYCRQSAEMRAVEFCEKVLCRD